MGDCKCACKWHKVCSAYEALIYKHALLENLNISSVNKKLHTKRAGSDKATYNLLNLNKDIH